MVVSGGPNHRRTSGVMSKEQIDSSPASSASTFIPSKGFSLGCLGRDFARDVLRTPFENRAAGRATLGRALRGQVAVIGWLMVKPLTRAMLALALVPGTLWAGPPFRTDDPEPVDYQHYELYTFFTGIHLSGDTSGVGPGLEFNYGLIPNGQFHLVAPLAFDSPSGDMNQFGYGDTELGFKYQNSFKKTRAGCGRKSVCFHSRAPRTNYDAPRNSPGVA